MRYERTVIHVDMDCFYAAVERLDNPELMGKAGVVGADPDGRGVVSACSYEARAFGVHSAMPIREAKKRCPHAVFLPVHMGRYEEMSGRIMDILNSYTDATEQVSVDEAFLDVTGCFKLFGSGAAIGRMIKDQIWSQTGLVASVGVAPCKFVSKIASDHGKPDGFVVVEPDAVLAFLHPLPVGKLWGVGKQTEKLLHALNLKTIGQVYACPQEVLCAKIGDSSAQFLKELAAGIDNRPVAPQGEAKSMSEEHTFQEDTDDKAALRRILLGQTDTVAHRLRQNAMRCRTVYLIFRNTDFTKHTRRMTLEAATDSSNGIFACIEKLLAQEDFYGKKVRLIGMGVTNFGEDRAPQLDLFAQKKEGATAAKSIDAARDIIAQKFGKDTLMRAALTRPADRMRP